MGTFIAIVITAVITFFVAKALFRSSSTSSASQPPKDKDADETMLAMRKHFLGEVNPTIEEQWVVLAAVMYAHAAIAASEQMGALSGMSSAQQDEWLDRQIKAGLSRSNYSLTFLRVKLARYAFDLYRDFYTKFLELLPPAERSLTSAQSKIARISADFLKEQFVQEGKADICAFLKANLHSLPKSATETPLSSPATTSPQPSPTNSEEHSSRKTSVQNTKILAFKSTEAAFQYSCKYLKHRIAVKTPIIGAVLGINSKNGPCVKVVNHDNDSIPRVSYMELLKTCDVRHTCFFTEALGDVPPIKAGDLVMFVPTSFAEGGMLAMGLIVAKLKPVFNLETGEFSIERINPENN